MKDELTVRDKILSVVLHVHSSYPEKADATSATQLLDRWPAGFCWLAELQFCSSITDNQLYLKGDR